jgi:nucleotide-binding universal stress UspA family protein
MYKHILIATDGSELSAKAIEHGLGLAKALGAKVTAVTVSEPWSSVVSGEMTIGFPIEDYNKSVAANADRILAQAADLAKSAGATCQTVYLPDHHPAEGILEAAKTRGCDLIVMASHGRRGVSRLLLGSQANRVVTHSTLPVLICR